MSPLDQYIAAAAAPFDEATTLPPSAYHDPAVFELERERVLDRAWRCVGHVSQLAEDGALLPRRVAGREIVLIRHAGTITARSNVCLHRGALLAGSACTARHLVCPYHAWGYGLDGRLLTTPFAPGLADRVGDPVLAEFATEVWNGWIYVSFAESPEPLADNLGGLGELIAECRVETMVVATELSEVWPVNWKVLAENFIESYHLFSVHRETLEPITPSSTARCLPGGPGYAVHTLDVLPVGDRQRGLDVLVAIFPAHVVSVMPASALWLALDPIDAGSVMVHAAFAVQPAELERRGLTIDEYAAVQLEYFHRFNNEDKAVCASVMAGLRSPTAVAGPLAPLERPVWELHQYLGERLAG